MAATNPPVAASNLVVATTGISVHVTDLNDPAERELSRLMEDDNAAQAEADDWIRENNQFAVKGAGVSNHELNRRILKRFEEVRKGYENFIKSHPDNAKARIAFASFLHDVGADGQVEQLEKARELDPKDPAIWNNLANYYGEFSPVKKAFEYYEKAIELDPRESLYYHNFATTVCMFRKDAREYYHLTEQEVFDKALEFYTKALKLDPKNFPLATDLAQTYYIIRPARTDAALRAWTNAMSVAHDEVEREGVSIHLARFKLGAGRFAEARAHLNSVTNGMYAELKNRLAHNLEEKEKMAEETNRPPAKASWKN
jgi:tetratricopeptide (TPR) repeat protein